MKLCRLIYSSHAIPDLSYKDLKGIMEKSEKNNTPLGITGMLCFGNSMFLQILEGDRRKISETYGRIANDVRHFDPELIDFSEIECRLFANWSMNVVQLGEYSPEDVKKITIKNSSSPLFSPSSMTTNQCLNFMLEFSTLVT